MRMICLAAKPSLFSLWSTLDHFPSCFCQLTFNVLGNVIISARAGSSYRHLGPPEFFYLPWHSRNLQCMVRLRNHPVSCLPSNLDSGFFESNMIFLTNTLLAVWKGLIAPASQDGGRRAFSQSPALLANQHSCLLLQKPFSEGLALSALSSTQLSQLVALHSQ